MNHFPSSLYRLSSRDSRRMVDGSAIVVALVLIALSSALMGGWIAIITARSRMVEQMTLAAQRRIAMENSKALAQEFVLERVIPSTSGAAFSYNLPEPAWGGISVPAWTGAPLQSAQLIAGYNHFAPGNGTGYTFNLTITVYDGSNPQLDYYRDYYVNSRSPILSGVLLSSQTPTLTPLTPPSTLAINSINVNGSAFVWAPSLSMSFKPNSYSTPEGKTAVTFANSGGTPVEMSSFALPQTTANPRTSGAFYTGEFDAINNANPAAYSSTVQAAYFGVVNVVSTPGTPSNPATGVVCDASGNVTITLNTPDLVNVCIPGQINTLTLEGQTLVNDPDAIDLPAILIIVDQPTGSPLNNITLTLNNSRRLIVAVKKATFGTTSLTFSGTSATWRMLLEAENTTIRFVPTTAVTLQGGIRSDSNILISSGIVNLTPESDPKSLLERMASRNAWIESFLQ